MSSIFSFAYRTERILRLGQSPPLDLNPPLRPATPCHSLQEWKILLAINSQEKKIQRQIQREVCRANHQVLHGIENLSEIPKIYHDLFYRTRTFAASVKEGIEAEAKEDWAEMACKLVDWSANELRDEKVCFEQFLHSQRCSIYSILDDTLLGILLSQWEDSTARIPWDVGTSSLRRALSQAESLLPRWAESEYQEMIKWRPRMENDFVSIEALEQGYFKMSRRFLSESMRIHEIWRTVNVGSRGRLPVELAKGIVEDVLRFEELPTGELRNYYLPKGKEKAYFPRR